MPSLGGWCSYSGNPNFWLATLRDRAGLEGAGFFVSAAQSTTAPLATLISGGVAHPSVTFGGYLTPGAQASLYWLQAEGPAPNMGSVISDTLLKVIATRNQP